MKFAAFLALFALTYAKKPADRDHPYGHEKIEFFSSGKRAHLDSAACKLNQGKKGER